jgi:hypothetical protein
MRVEWVFVTGKECRQTAGLCPSKDQAQPARIVLDAGTLAEIETYGRDISEDRRA